MSKQELIKISEYLESDRVLYRCTCNTFKTIHRLYFCRHCNEIRCRDCVLHEIDSQYCENCLEYIPSMEAKIKKNKCECFECPFCQSTLTTKFNRAASSSSSDSSNASQVTKKLLIYLYCQFCRWSTRDIGLSDHKSIYSALASEQVIENFERLEQLAEYYRKLALCDKFESDKNKRLNSGRMGPVILLEKYGISCSLSEAALISLRAKASMRIQKNTRFLDKSTELNKIVPAEVINDEQMKKLKDDALKFYKSDNDRTEPKFSNRTSLKQRFQQMDRQSEIVDQAYPVPKTLVVKRSFRCKKCDHNLLKPEFNPSVVKFKLQLSALQQIPEVKLAKVNTFKMGETSRVEITITNPTQYHQNLSLLPVDVCKDFAAEVILPNTMFRLAPKDDTGDLSLDLDSSGEAARTIDDPNVVSFRTGNKIGVFLFVTPLTMDRDCVVEFRLKHDFIVTILPLSSTDPEKKIKLSSEVKWITQTMRLNLGKITGSS